MIPARAFSQFTIQIFIEISQNPLRCVAIGVLQLARAISSAAKLADRRAGIGL